MNFHTSVPASSKQDLYQILSVPRTATQKEIKQSYYQVCHCLPHVLCLAPCFFYLFSVVTVVKNVFVFVALLLLLQLAKKFHPDTNKDDPQAKEKFAQLAEAYEVRISPGGMHS